MHQYNHTTDSLYFMVLVLSSFLLYISEGLIAAGESVNSPPIQKAVTFILGKQNPNGGWGESYVACVNKCYPAGGTGEVSWHSWVGGLERGLV